MQPHQPEHDQHPAPTHASDPATIKLVNRALQLMFDTDLLIAEIASMLQLDLLTPDAQYSPGFLETFDLLTASSITLNGLVIATNDPSGTVFSPSVIDNADGSQTLRITAVPTPATAALLGAATLVAARRRRVPPTTAG